MPRNVSLFLQLVGGEKLPLGQTTTQSNIINFSYEDCEHEIVDIPYFDSEEICEEVEYDECRELEVQVPIKICKSVDPNREPIINRQIAGTETRQPGRQRELRY